MDGGGEMLGVVGMVMETGTSAEICAIKLGEAVVHHRDSNSCLTTCQRR